MEAGGCQEPFQGPGRFLPDGAFLEACVKTLFHFFPQWRGWLGQFPDPRDQERIIYPRQVLIMAAVLLFWLRLASRRQWRLESQSEIFTENVNRILNCQMDQMPHGDTLVYYLTRVPLEPFQDLNHRMIRRLIRTKSLDGFRLYGTLTVGIDGTGQHVFRQKHCDHCLVQKKDGKILYYFHNVLEAKIVCPNGLVLSIGTEFIENEDPSASRQDCELNAFFRLARAIKKAFPQLRLCLLLDGLYACAPVLKLCEDFRWKYIITFKEGSLPSAWEEFSTLKKLTPRNRVSHAVRKDVVQALRWVEDLDHKGQRFNAIECLEHDAGKGMKKRFAWITNVDVGCKSVITLANKGGRLRWKIENEGFNTQKNGGYELEHPYSKHPRAMKIFYHLLQIAHLLQQLVEKGSLLKTLRATWGSIKNFIRRLCEQFRHVLVSAEALNPGAIQIRLDSS
jgi:hypothetical protein